MSQRPRGATYRAGHILAIAPRHIAVLYRMRFRYPHTGLEVRLVATLNLYEPYQLAAAPTPVLGSP